MTDPSSVAIVSSDPALVEVLSAHRFDEIRLAAYLKGRLDGFDGALTVRQFQGGQSNPTFLLDTLAGKLVLRKKPPGVLLPSAHQIEREFRVILALHGTGVPVPHPLLLCDDPGVIGAPFYVMRHVAGRIFDHPKADAAPAHERGLLYAAMARTLAALHKVDPQAVGLGDFGRPDRYLARQIDRWSGQYRASLVEAADPNMERLMRWLPGNLPPQSRVAIAHGDFRIGNLIFAANGAEVAAILDWELSTLGDPLSDLAYCCLPYHLPGDASGVKGLKGLNLKTLGIPTEAEFVETYRRAAGVDAIGQWPFYLAFSLFRLAAILQGVHARAVAGNASSANALEVGRRAALLAETGCSIAFDGASFPSGVG